MCSFVISVFVSCTLRKYDATGTPAKGVLLHWFLVASLRTWTHGRCLGWQPCRWGSGAGWWRSRYTPPGDRRGWIRWTPACPCTLCRSSLPVAASAAPLGWAHSLQGGTAQAHVKMANVWQLHKEVDLWPSSPVATCVVTLGALELCLTSGPGGHKPDDQNNCNCHTSTITNILHFYWVTQTLTSFPRLFSSQSADW